MCVLMGLLNGERSGFNFKSGYKLNPALILI